MRCHCVQALWGPYPPQHEVVSMVACENPFSLWTGGIRGDIICWKLHPRPPDENSTQELFPGSLLCGHMAPIADLTKCRIYETRDVEVYNNAGLVDGRFCKAYDVIVSLCTEGYMCAWDSSTGRCQKRRKLPPWTGRPCAMTAVPESLRYAAIACDGMMTNLSAGDTGNEMRRLVDDARTLALEKSGSIKKNMKGTVIIIDSSNLSVLQVIYNGFLGIGPVRSILVMQESDSDHKLMVSDAAGRIRSWEITLGKTVTQNLMTEELDRRVSFSDSRVSLSDSEQKFSDGALSVSLSPDGLHVLLVFIDQWVIVTRYPEGVLSHVEGKLKVGECICFAGGFFFIGLGDFIVGNGTCQIINLFIVFDTHGSAVVYSLHSTNTQSCVTKEVFVVPPTFPTKLSIKFYQLKEFLIRVGCGCSNMWIDVWLLQLRSLHTAALALNSDANSDPNHTFVLHAQGGLLAYGEHPYLDSLLNNAKIQLQATRVETEKVISPESFSTSVTASLLLFDKSAIPVAFVLGFNQGEIRIKKFHIFRSSVLDRKNGFLWDMGESSDHILFKHTAPITCLSEHSLSLEGRPAKRLLLSGGADCLVCVWDLEKGFLLSALHSHVTSVQQILLPLPGTNAPWSNCFVTVGEDGCVALTSLETLQLERMLVGHPCQPKMIVWDGVRGYLSCLCTSISGTVMANDVLFIWDLKSGALERVLRGSAAHSMFDNFKRQVQRRLTVDSNVVPRSEISCTTFLYADTDSPHTESSQDLHEKKAVSCDPASILEYGKLGNGPNSVHDEVNHLPESTSNKVIGSLEKLSSRITQVINPSIKTLPLIGKDNISESDSRNLFHKQPPVRGTSPFPGVAALQFDLFTLMAPDLGRLGKDEKLLKETKAESLRNHFQDTTARNKNDDQPFEEGLLAGKTDKSEFVGSLGSFEGSLLRMSLAFLHLWGADVDLDHCLEEELMISQPRNVGVATGFSGDRGAATLFFPGQCSSLGLWIMSSEFCALRSLMIVATALRMTTLSRLASNATSALVAFYTRGLADKFPAVKAASLELYACFWQDPSEHVRMAARSLFHCAASRAIPPVLSAKNTLPIVKVQGKQSESVGDTNNSLLKLEQQLVSESVTAEEGTWPEIVSSSAVINDWIDSFENQTWTAVVGGTNQDARAGRIIVAAALAVWYPGLVRSELAPSVVPYLVKLVKAAVDRHSAVAAELLSDGMESVWKHLLSKEVPHLVADVFLLIDCLSGGTSSAKSSLSNSPATAMTIRETLTGSLLPCLAIVDISNFLHLVHGQLSGTPSDSSVHMIALMTIIRIIRGASRTVLYHLTQVTSIILRSMNCGKHCHQTAMAAVREMVRIYPMVALHQSSGKLAVGDAVGDVHSLAIQIYDLNSATKVKVLDASGPPGHPALLANSPISAKTGGISALTFSEDGEGVAAFSQHGLIIRWWYFSSVWWEKLSRVTTPMQCNKLVLVPPWAGFSPKSSRSSMMEVIANTSQSHKLSEEVKEHNVEDAGRACAQTIDLSFKLDSRPGKKVVLSHHGQELGVFQL